MATHYLRNAWYAAAWADEIADKPIGRVLLDRPVVIYRGEGGALAALDDTCPHRLAPLHRGQVCGDAIVCAYHGMHFGRSGACVHNPHGPIPEHAKIRAYPVAERYGLVWTWLGEQPADTGALPDVPELAEPGMAWVRGTVSVAGNYQLMIDNLLDLTHVEFMHPMLGTPGSAARVRHAARHVGDVVYSTYDLPNEPPSLVVRMLWPDGPDLVQMSSPMRWMAPSNLVLNLHVTTVGGDLATPYLKLPTCHFLTPESAGRTHYFWLAGRNRDIDNPQVSEMTRMGIEHTFTQEDEPMIAAIEARMERFDTSAIKPVIFQTDAATVQARRVLERLIAAEG